MYSTRYIEYHAVERPRSHICWTFHMKYVKEYHAGISKYSTGAVTYFKLLILK